MEYKVTLKGKEYTISNEGFYPMILFKRKTGKNFEVSEDIEELLTLIYCYIQAYNKDLDFDLEEFFLIANSDLINSFNKLHNQENQEETKKN